LQKFGLGRIYENQWHGTCRHAAYPGEQTIRSDSKPMTCLPDELVGTNNDFRDMLQSFCSFQS
jgi:hypothetical protein